MNVKKLRHHKGKTTIHVEAQNENDMETTQLNGCADAPNESFIKALEAVTKDVLRMTGIQGKGFEEALSVIGLTLDKQSPSGRRTVAFKIAIETPMGFVIGNLDTMRERLDDEQGPLVLSDLVMKHVEKLVKEAAGYYNGNRVVEQMTLDTGEKAAAGVN